MELFFKLGFSVWLHDFAGFWKKRSEQKMLKQGDSEEDFKVFTYFIFATVIRLGLLQITFLMSVKIKRLKMISMEDTIIN